MPLPAVVLPAMMRWVASYLVKSALSTVLKSTTPYEFLVSYLQERFKCSQEVATVVANTIMSGGKVNFSLTDTIKLAQAPETKQFVSTLRSADKYDSQAFISNMIDKGLTNFKDPTPLTQGDQASYLKMLDTIENIDVNIKNELMQIIKTNKSAQKTSLRFIYEERFTPLTDDDLVVLAIRNAKTLETAEAKAPGDPVPILNPILRDRYLAAKDCK